jgi:NDP-sugar pyrophosphorylase family protein
LGYLGSQIEDYFGDGKKWGVAIHCHYEQSPLGRTGALLQIQENLKEDFLFLSGDVMMDFDVKKFIDWHQDKKDTIASVVVHPSDHPLDSDLVEANAESRITSLLLKPHTQQVNVQNLGIASVFIFSPKMFSYIPKNMKSDFEKDVLPIVLKSSENVYAYKTSEYIKDMGTPERLEKVRKEYLLWQDSKAA